MSLSYSAALSIAKSLIASPDSTATQLLKATCAHYDVTPTFAIMRAGSPLDWTEIPRISKRGRPSKEMMRARFTEYGKARLEGPFTLRHIETGATVTALTVRDLVTAIGMEDTLQSQVHINGVISGRRSAALGWHLASTLDRTISLQDVYGNQYPTMTVEQYAKRFGRSVGSALRLLDGRKRFERGVALASTSIAAVTKPRAQSITSISATRDGVTITARSIPKLARRLNMDQQAVRRMAYGFKGATNGFTISNATVHNKAVLTEVGADA